MTKQNENRPGYKKTKVGWIPEEWGTPYLKDCALVRSSNVDKKSYDDEFSVKLCNYTDVYYNNYITNDMDFMEATAKESEVDKFTLQIEDVIITKDSESADDRAVPAVISEKLNNVLCGYHLTIIRPDKKTLSGYFLNQLLCLHQIRYYFFTLANGVTRFGLPLESIQKANIPLPPLPEQKKIAEILSSWDRAIEKSEKLVEKCELRKKGLLNQLTVNSDQLSVKKEEWEEKELGKVLIPELFPVPKPNMKYKSLGIRSHGKGTFQKVVEDPSKVAMEILYEVKPEQLIVNITFAWEGAIAIIKPEDEGHLVSHRFPTYAINESEADLDYIRYLIHTPRMKYNLVLISPGGAGRNRVMSKKDFLKLKFSFPPLEEQKKTGKILRTADKEVNKLKSKLDALKKQKKGLMQKLLTGEIRTVVSDQ